MYYFREELNEPVTVGEKKKDFGNPWKLDGVFITLIWSLSTWGQQIYKNGIWRLRIALGLKSGLSSHTFTVCSSHLYFLHLSSYGCWYRHSKWGQPFNTFSLLIVVCSWKRCVQCIPCVRAIFGLSNHDPTLAKERERGAWGRKLAIHLFSRKTAWYVKQSSCV